MAVVLKKLAAAWVEDAEAIDGSFEIESRLLPSFRQGIADFEIIPAGRRTKRYEDDDTDELRHYMGDDSKLAIIAYSDGLPAGLVLARENWNGYALIDNIKVDAAHRKSGIGRLLVDAVADWARSGNLAGLMLETQDNNVNACLFYRRYGFVLRGFDTGLYAAIPATREETALFWYLTF